MSANNEALLDMVGRAAVALAKAHGLDFNEVCGLEADPLGDCNSSTCVAAWNEDHDASLCRDQYLRDARTVLGSLSVVEGWAFVMRAPTDEMIRAGWNCIDWARSDQTQRHPEDRNCRDGSGEAVGTTPAQDVRDAWQAMIAASPSFGSAS